jgi:hypothetical protein
MYVVKTIKRSLFEDSNSISYHKEVEALKLVNHPNIIKMYGNFD